MNPDCIGRHFKSPSLMIPHLHASRKDVVINILMTNSTIYTIGHGRHPFEFFLELLRRHKIAFLCDVRSVPRSRWPQYNAGNLARALQDNGIGYEHLPECGGKVVAPLDELMRGL